MSIANIGRWLWTETWWRWNRPASDPLTFNDYACHYSADVVNRQHFRAAITVGTSVKVAPRFEARSVTLSLRTEWTDQPWGIFVALRSTAMRGDGIWRCLISQEY